jgi:hypothetical protein
MGMLSPVKRILIICVVVAAALGTAGCGAPRERQAAAVTVASRLLQAVRGGDGSGACGLLAPATRASLEESAGQACPAAILDEDLPAPQGSPASRVFGQWAQVRYRDDALFLAVFPGGWRVVAAGCTPRGERPYDCKLQGS